MYLIGTILAILITIGLLIFRIIYKENKQMIEKIIEEQLAICQMNTLHIVRYYTEMDLSDIIKELNLDKEEYGKLAFDEGIVDISEEIQKVINNQ